MSHAANDVLSSLPVVECLARILYDLSYGWRVWRELCLALPAFGRYSLHEWVQRNAMRAFIRFRGPAGECGRVLPNGAYHSINGEYALLTTWGRYWYKKGKKHRDNDKPAVVSLFGGAHQEWWVDGKLHRDNDEPAIITTRRKEWWAHGERMRIEYEHDK